MDDNFCFGKPTSDVDSLASLTQYKGLQAMNDNQIERGSRSTWLEELKAAEAEDVWIDEEAGIADWPESSLLWMLVGETAWARNWDTPEEDEAWVDL